MNSYRLKSEESDESGDTTIEKLEKKIKSLEAKLHRARGEEKTSIQAQIQAIQLVILALI